MEGRLPQDVHFFMQLRSHNNCDFRNRQTTEFREETIAYYHNTEIANISKVCGGSSKRGCVRDENQSIQAYLLGRIWGG